MQTRFTPVARKKSAYILILTMFFLTATLVVFGGLWYWTSGNSIQTARNSQYIRSQAAAEAATETVLATMMRDYLSQSLTNSSYYATLLPNQNFTNSAWPVQFSFSDTNGGTNAISIYFSPTSTNTVPLTSQYAGLYGLVQNVIITSKATPIGQQYTVPATVSEGLQFAAIPIFQFAIFYNLNLEIDPGSTMTISGPVFSNAGIWSGNGNVTYSSSVQAVDQVTLAGDDPFCSNKSDTGNSVFSQAGQPTSGATPLKMPVGTNSDPAGVHAILDLPPSSYALGTAAAYTTNGQVYLANAADLLVFNSVNGTNYGSLTPYGTNFTLYYQDGSLAQIPYDFFIVTNRGTKKLAVTNYVTAYQLTNLLNLNNMVLTNYSGAVVYAGYSFLTNTLFYDAREGYSGAYTSYGKPVQAVQIDIGKFNTWLTNSTATNNGIFYNNRNVTDKGHSINSIYVYNGAGLTSTNILTNSTFMGAVRLNNGAKLSSAGLTVATPFPIYVWGNYNVTGASGTKTGVNNQTANYTYPAALMGDSVTILSANWSDVPHAKGSPTTPTATTVNAACLEGIVESDGSNYSGGVENFLRLLEAWTTSIQLTYNGSIVVMFPSQVAVGSWNGNYYGVPKRAWAFDTNFRNQSGLPPLTPQTKAVIRAAWYGQ